VLLTPIPLFLVQSLEYKEAEARTFRQLYEAEKARVQQLEKLLQEVTSGTGGGGGASSLLSPLEASFAQPPPVRALVRVTPSGSQSARSGLCPFSATPRKQPPLSSAAAVVGSTEHFISRRHDTTLLAPHTLNFASPASSSVPYPRTAQRPQSSSLQRG